MFSILKRPWIQLSQS